MAINCIVVEDEPLAILRLKEFIGKVPFLNLLRAFNNPIEPLAFVTINKVDLIFLDIQMDGLSGFGLIETMRERPEIILTTAHDKYAMKGYEFSVADYLLKPFTFERFLHAASKVNSKIAPDMNHASYVFIKTEHRHERIFVDDILYIEGRRDYRKIQTREKAIMTMDTFGELEKTLPSHLFCRVHKSWMVSMKQIELVERDRITISKATIPISETFKDAFYGRIAPFKQKKKL